MFGMFRKSLQTGIVTSAYPAVPEAAPDAFRGRPVFNADRCELSGTCARICPTLAITVANADASEELAALAPAVAQRDVPTAATRRDREARGNRTQQVWQIDYARCVFCGLCVESCRSGALAQTNDFELAVKRRDDLVVRAVFVGDQG